MAGYGLSNAVRAYQQGVAWRQQQDETDKHQKRQAALDEADRAAASIIDASKAERAMNGAQGEYQPSDATMFKAAQARGAALAKSGDWENYLRNEARVQQQRIRVRAGALQRYELDGDFESLARTVDPTMFNGREIVASERLGGMPALDSIGRPAEPTRFKFKFSDGTEQEVQPEVMVKKLKLALMDPMKMAEQEIQANFLRTKAEIEADKQIKVAGARGEEARKTEGVRQDGRRGLETLRQDGRVALQGTKLGGALQLADVNNSSRERIADDRNATTLAAVDRREAGAGARATARGAGGAGGGKAAGAPDLQSTKVDADGYVLGVFRNGQARRLTSDDGKPIRSGDWSKRVDSLAKTLRDAPGNFSKPAADLRREAEAALAGGAPAQGRPPLDSFTPKPGLGSAPAASRPPLSQFMVK